MASQEELAPLLPETLPEDFGDWDSEASAERLPDNSGEWEAWIATHSFGETPKPLGHSADRDAIVPPVVDRPRVSGSASSAPVSIKKQKEFIDWDSEASPTAPPVNPSEWDAWVASFGKSTKPLVQSADRDAIVPPGVDRPRVSGSASSAPVSLKPQKSTSALVDVSPSRTSHTLDASHTTNEVPVAPSLPDATAVDGMRNSPELTATLTREADKDLFRLFPSKNIEVKGEQKTAKKKRMRVAAVCACSILLPLLLMIPLFHHGTKSAAKHSVQPPAGASDSQPKTNTPALSASEPLTQDKPLATTERQETPDNQPTNEEEGVNSAQVQTKMMNDQLTAPIRIPQDIKKQVAENGPPPASFGAAGADGLGGNGAINGVFNGHAQPVIKFAPSKPLAISSGVAVGMLIEKTPPVYPPIAKESRVSGTVELHAIISKNGTIKDLQVMSGPTMLRQAALDAVRTWRYKPYRLNNAPTEVETTINVIFSLGG